MGCWREEDKAYRFDRSTSAFLHTRFEYRRPTPLILVRAYMIFCLPSTLVLSRRRMYWKLDFSPDTRAVGDVVSRCFFAQDSAALATMRFEFALSQERRGRKAWEAYT